MDSRILVSGETDITQFARVASLDQSGIGAFGIEYAMGIFKAQNLVMLDQVDAVDLQPFQRFVQLFGGCRFRAAIAFRHHESLLSITIFESLSRALFARAFVIVPAVVQKIDTAIDGAAHNADGKLFIDVLQAEMPAAHTNG